MEVKGEMVTILLVVRHGQTAWNKEERFRGQTDLPLDETGLRQAQATGQYITARYRPNAVLSSPLRRAMQTAEAICRPLNLTVEPHQGLLDLNFGDFAGLTIPEARARSPEICRAWFSAPHTVRFPGGESLDDVRGRVKELVHYVVGQHSNQQVVLVTHQVVCRVLFCVLLDLDNRWFWRLRVDTASVTAYEVDRGQVTLVFSNDTCHLHALK